MKEQMMRFFKDEDGATAIEYGLIAGLVAVALIVAFGALGESLDTLFDSIKGKVDGVNTAVVAAE